jgi:hypothetical protein
MGAIRKFTATKRTAALAAVFVVISLVAFASLALGAKPVPTDTAAPAISVSAPVDGSSYNTSGWNNNCAGGGICGTASDASGVALVRVAIRQQATQKYWNGSSFVASTSAIFNSATGTTSWSYALTAPIDGDYTVSVRAKDTLNNETAAANQKVVTFRLDRVGPPVSTVTQTPDNPTSKTNAQFKWSNTESGVAYRCALDNGAESPCTSSGLEYKSLAIGEHCIAVVALDAAGNRSVAASYCWSVSLAGGFGITGTVADLAPGVSKPINLTIANPYNFAIKVTSVTATVNPTTSKPGCNGPQNLTVVQSLVAQPTVPANATRTLQQLGVATTSWPLVRMPNLATNQDSCKQATFTMTFTGTAVKP